MHNAEYMCVHVNQVTCTHQDTHVGVTWVMLPTLKARQTDMSNQMLYIATSRNHCSEGWFTSQLYNYSYAVNVKSMGQIAAHSVLKRF